MKLVRSLLVASLLASAICAQPGDEGWPDADVAALHRASAAIEGGRFDEALRELEALLPAHPRSGTLLRLVGHALAGSGRRLEARETLVRALALGELSVDLLARLVELDREAGREQAMLAAVRLLVLLAPEEPAWPRLLAELAHARGENATATRLYSDLVERDGPTSELAERLGLLAYERGDERAAAVQWETAFFLGDRAPGRARRLATLWLRLGDPERALTWTRLESGSSAFEDHVVQAELLLAAGDAPAARALLADAPMELDASTRARIAVVLGHCARRAGDEAEALRRFRAALEAGATSEDLVLFVADRLRLAGDDAGALAVLRPAAERAGARADLLERTVASLIAAGELDDARTFLARLVEEHGWSERAERLVRSLAARR